jgi:hypothetical protein
MNRDSVKWSAPRIWGCLSKSGLHFTAGGGYFSSLLSGTARSPLKTGDPQSAGFLLRCLQP